MVEEIWVEKYRPDKVEDIVGQDQVVERLKGYVSEGNLPNMLFAGRPGVGKTTAALALTKELFGGNWRANFLELNASDERGIDVVRGKIKDFARTKPIGGDFKIIFLDEADALTRDAQQALRRTMEKYSGTCRFILSCNYSSKIIEPIQSRCALFRFKGLETKDIKKRMEFISKKEELEITDDGIEAILYSSEGDLRKAINLLQSSSAMNKKIDSEVIYGVTSRARPKEIRKVVKTALKGDFVPARDALRKLIISYGMSGEDVVKQLHKEVFNLDLEDEIKVKLADVVGEYEFRLVEGSNELIQLEALLAQFTLFGNKKQKTIKHEGD
ncbi:MAG: replication factor C small subunit [Candidatus Hydrothermarchaeales archaeon]